MKKEDLLFYEAYESFYEMVMKSDVFCAFCKDAFGEDFSQDGFSDLNQIDMILQVVPQKEDIHILDIGCGNGKMLGYLQKKTGAKIYGFDYSENAIKFAKHLFSSNSEFTQGLIGEVEYPNEKFDVITSMDTIYFASNMANFVLQAMNWLKKGGVFFVGYQEGEMMSKTDNANTTVLAKVLKENEIEYETRDITRPTYDLLVKKRNVALMYEADFEKEGYKEWFNLLMLQTECVNEGYNSFANQMARYIYIIRK